MMSEVMPCPFCGDDDLLGTSNGQECYYIECNGCGCSGPAMSNVSDATTAWNTRTPDPRITKLVEAIRTPIGECDMDQSDNDVLSDRVKVLEAHIENIERALSAFNGDGK